ncbi:MAG TPA: L-seryl-tRNA(Sec) selenium transferase [Gemmatimonadaceae bacterium]|nr:L-seryl-tRNA(Sec) selenium transferase [Gemmatimonadaceae bacterium]
MTDPRRAIPSISGLLEREGVRALLSVHPRSVVVDAARRAVDEARRNPDSPASTWEERIIAQVDAIERRSLRPVFNATGVILHTNLGRAPLADAAIAAIAEVAGGYTNLEYDLATGARGSRYVHCVDLLRELTGADDAIVVNNCASGLVLSLSALARDREVIVSRGELVEIGGSFRVPDIMARSGATLVEVGTTNRTHIEDYSRAISSRTGAIAKIHRSNFSQSGFVADVSVQSLTPIAAEHGIPIVHDLGSGLMIDLSEYGLSGEPTARAALEAGATLVLMSGDKLLGGPQAGIVLGARHAIARMRQDPFARAMRVDKLTIAALTATLELYRDPAQAVEEIPALAMIASSAERIRKRCERVSESLAARGIASRVAACTATVGAGAFPTDSIPSFAVVIGGNAVKLEEALRLSPNSPVIGRIADDELMLDLRSVPERDDAAFADAVGAALS